MLRPVHFPPAVESLVRVVEETPPDRIVGEAVGRLRDGADSVDLLRASVLAAMRSTELSVGHHGGPMHVMCGVQPALETSRRLTGAWAFVPIVQHVALANAHIHAPEMGNGVLTEQEPLQATDLPRFLWERGFEPAEPLADTRRSFVRMIETKQQAPAEGHLLWLLGQTSRDDVLDLLLGHALPMNPADDHYVLFPLYAARALDVIGWDWAPVLLRLVVRWQARNPYRETHPAFAAVERVLAEYRLDEDTVRLDGPADETAIGEVAAQVGSVDALDAVPTVIAQALADGLPLTAAGEALSIGAGGLFLRTDYGNPLDAHMHTGINVRRRFLQLEGVGLRNKLLALLTWSTGWEISVSRDRLDWLPRADPARLAALPERSQAELLDEIEAQCRSYPVPDDLSLYALFSLRTAPELRHCMALAEQYAACGYEARALFERLATIACRDDFTEMHALKHHQAVVEEYFSVAAPFRWVHLVGAVKFAALSHGASQRVFEAAARALDL